MKIVKAIGAKSKQEKLFVYTPFDSDFPREARNRGGDWNGKAWVFDVAQEKSVKELVKDFFGWDGSGETGTAQIKTTELQGRHTGPAELFGFVLAQARGRDSGAKTGEGVRLVSGSISSGGSVKNWHSYVDADTIFEIDNFPLNANLPNGYEYVSQDTDKEVLEKLIVEKERELSELKEKLSKLR